jgi:PAS domain S-box-containing protein
MNARATVETDGGRSEEYLRLLIESASDYAIFTLDVNRRVISWNTGAEALTGYAEQEIIGQSGDIIFTHEDREKKAPEHEVHTAHMEGRAQNERWHVRKNGARFWGSGSVSPLLDNDGELIGFVKIMRDLTERREAEERYRTRMEREVQERTEELKTAKESLQATLDSSLYVVQAFKAVRDGAGNIIDFTWVFTNRLWNELHGDVIGKRLLHENPAVVPTGLFEKFVQVTETGVPIDHEQYYTHEQFNGWFRQMIVKMGDGFVINTEEITDRKKVEEENLRLKDEVAQKATDKYRTLFNSIDEGFGIAEVLFDDAGDPADYRWVEINPQFEKTVSTPGDVFLSGKTMRELFPKETNDSWYSVYDKVALTGEPVRFEAQAKTSDNWFDVYVFRMDKRHLAILFSNITERKHHEANMHFLAEVTGQFSMLSSPQEIMQTVGEKIGSYMKVGSCNFVDIDEGAEKEMVVSYSWHRSDMPVFPPAFRIKDYLTELFESASRAGQTIVVSDTQTDPRTNALGYDALKINTFITVPFFQAGRWKHFLAVSGPEPRNWRPDEIELFQDLANIIFPRLEQVRAIEALRESEARFRLMVDAVPLAIWITDTEGRVEFLNKHWCDYAGITFEATTAAEVARDFVHPADAPILMAAFTAAMQAGRGFEVEQRNRSASGEYRWFFNRGEPYYDPHSGAIVKWFGVSVDIHDRKLAEKAVRKSEERLLTLVENLPGGAAFVVDAGLHYLLAGGEALTDAGLKPEHFINKTVAEAVSPEQAAVYQPHYEKVLQGGTFNLEHEINNRSFLTRGVPLRNDEGDVYAALAVSYDITSRKIAERKLRERKEHLKLLANAVPQVIWSNDAKGRANFFNQRWYDYSGLSFEESVGVGWEAIVHPDDAPASKDKWQRALAEGKIFDTEYRLRNAAGEYCWFIGRNIPLRNEEGKILGWFGSATDINDLKNAQNELRSTAERLQLALEAGNLGTYEYDFQTQVYTSSVQHKANFGYAESEPVSFESLRERVVPADRQYMEASFNKAMHEDAVYSTEFRTQHPGGHTRWIRSVGRFIYNDKHEPQKVVGFTLDITEEKMFTEELSKQVKERTKELQQSNNDLQQFAHVASHDLKEPVRKIKTFNNRIIEDFNEVLPRKVQVYLDKINQATDRMFMMIEGVLNYSKLGKKQQVFGPVDLNKILRDIEVDLEVLVQKKSAVINKTYLPTITANETLIYQLFYNLVLNSLKFAKANEPSRINVTGTLIKRDQQNFVSIVLSDNGIGFEQEYAEAIFDTFKRLNPADEYEGTGLGLALSKKIVERHGGSITATGHEGVGATFTILLPVS